MTIVRTFNVHGLATVKLDTSDSKQPALEIILDPDYSGDLIELDRQTEDGDDRVYLSCNHLTAKGNVLLSEFMTELKHHRCSELCDPIHDDDCDPQCKRQDHPNCQKLIELIDQALYETDDSPRDFRRPADGLYTWLVMSIMPPAPDKHVVMGYGKLQSRFKWYHHVVGVVMLAGFIGLMTLQTYYVPWMKYSVITGVLALGDWAGLAWWLTLIVFVVVLNLMRRFGGQTVEGESSLSRYTIGFFSKAAVFEEQAFREGSENWNFQQRVRSCVAFGAIHMINLIYPLSSILPLALGGALFMVMYLRKYRRTGGNRRAAVLRAAVWHRVYNRVALAAFVLSLSLWFGLKALALVLTVFTLVFIGGFIIDRRQYRRADSVGATRDRKAVAARK